MWLKHLVFISPSCSSLASSGYRPEWVPLDSPKEEHEKGTQKTFSKETAMKTSVRHEMMVVRLLTALLSSFLIVDLPQSALTPSTATARRKSDPGCPLCSFSSFITAPTTSLLVFTRVIPYSEEKQQKEKMSMPWEVQYQVDLVICTIKKTHLIYQLSKGFSLFSELSFCPNIALCCLYLGGKQHSFNDHI